MVIFNSYVSLPEGNGIQNTNSKEQTQAVTAVTAINGAALPQFLSRAQHAAPGCLDALRHITGELAAPNLAADASTM